ncbi:uncharacterized protein FA14DRAFT_158452 [Meira miltonrushii]|uniref:Uncharacterized protein n=1 Tax=Meira miltonrushii TaxID=1280837 RepID=A0A316V3R6_9BASI|nr:uncharacterized protein FA14DRAFT_158452 [Meira miltonrushii]PWN31638.1 hypothetical protein FA14DRAFT_158452 [Meira miltonrushii]
MSSWAPASARKPAPQHTFDRDYEATRPQRGESLYQWATADYFNMNHKTWLNGYTMIDHELKVVPKTEKFMLTAKVADEECAKCKEINRTRKEGEPKIPCIVSKVDGRCALCLVTKQKTWACQSVLPASYPWPSNVPRRVSKPAVPPFQQSSPVSPRSTSPAWTVDTVGEERRRRDGRDSPRERAPRRSASPVRQPRYYTLKAPTPKEPAEMMAQRKRRQSVSAFEVANSSTKSLSHRASTVEPGSRGNDDSGVVRPAEIAISTPPRPAPDDDDEPEEVHFSKEQIEAFSQSKKQTSTLPKERAGTRQSTTIAGSSTMSSPIVDHLKGVHDMIKGLEDTNSALLRERAELLSKIEELQAHDGRAERANMELKIATTESEIENLQIRNNILRQKNKEYEKKNKEYEEKYEESHKRSIRAEEKVSQHEATMRNIFGMVQKYQ